MRPALILAVLVLALLSMGNNTAPPLDRFGALQTAAPVRGGRIAFTSRRNGFNEIYLVDAVGSTPVRLAAGWSPAWSPDGTRLAFVMSDENKHDQIDVMNADGSGAVRLTQVKTRAASPAWSPDGTHIAYVSFDDGHPEIYVTGADGSDSSKLTDNFGTDPAWSPDGKTMAYVSAGEMYMMKLDGSKPVRITHNHTMLMGTGTDDLAWSPDGRTIAFSYYIDAHDAIFTVNADGTNLVKITPYGDFNFRSPSWSPDGKSIVYCYYDQSIEDLYIMNADGSNAVRLTRDYLAFQPAWAPLAGRSS